MPLDERSPLLQFPGTNGGQSSNYGDLHGQFCNLVGVPPMNLPAAERGKPHPESLYHRAVAHRRNQNAIYMFTATLTNGLLLSQVVLGAALTALGASDSSRVLITIFGALNTVIAGLVAFIKSRGQPVRARMFRDDLERVVDEIENSAVMWLGISRSVHGYSAIDTDEQVTVRSEVARLTRLYDRAVKTNTMNDPDMYAAGLPGDGHVAALRGAKGAEAAPVVQPAAPAVPVAGGTAPLPSTAAAAPQVADPDESPATKAMPPAASNDSSKDTEGDTSKDSTKKGSDDGTTGAGDKASDAVESAPSEAATGAGAESREEDHKAPSKGNEVEDKSKLS